MIIYSFVDDDIPDVLKPPEICSTFFMQTQGYRKVSGDYCMGGVDLGPVKVDCPKEENNSTETLLQVKDKDEIKIKQ